jgi:hypothetical protein
LQTPKRQLLAQYYAILLHNAGLNIDIKLSFDIKLKNRPTKPIIAKSIAER